MNKLTKVMSLAGLTMMSTMAAADFTMKCESYDHKYTTCPVETHGYVRLEEQHSRSPCIKGRTWDYNRHHIWVDDACKATFVVEGRKHTRHDSHHKGENVAAAVAGLALLAAAAHSDNDRDRDRDRARDRWNDDNYYGSRHTSYIPGWLEGGWNGYNPRAHVSTHLRIKDNGKVHARVGNIDLYGYINDMHLYLGDLEFNVQRSGRGFNLVEVGNWSNVVHYTRD